MISIIIPCYNAEKLVGKCIESVLRQTYGDVEVIAVNDCSDGITCRGAFFPYLKAHDLDGMIAVCKAEMRKGWKRGLLKRMMSMFYK